MSLMIALISAGSALFGASIGAVVSYFISKRQITATVISANRQKWINNLRDVITQFQSKITEIQLLASSQRPVLINASEANNLTKEVQNIANEISLLNSKLKLFINPKEPDNMKLIELFNTIYFEVLKRKMNNKIIKDIQESITSIAQKILKREWERVKKGK